MEKIKNVKEFVEKLDAAKKVNPKDLSSDQDLTIGIMNLISIEEHLMFSGAKTGKHQFYDLIDEVREQRKQMMQKIIPSYEGEVWCISKCVCSRSAPRHWPPVTGRVHMICLIGRMDCIAYFGD